MRQSVTRAAALAAALSLASVVSAARPTFEIYPRDMVVQAGSVVRFTAVERAGRDDAFTPPGMAWTATGGAIDAEGVFRAGQAPGRFEVSARSGSLHASVPVRVVKAEASPGATAAAQPQQSHFSIKIWDHGLATSAGPRLRIAVRAFGPALKELGLYLVKSDGTERHLVTRPAQDRRSVHFDANYQPEGWRWLELRLYDTQGRVVASTRRLI